MAKARETRRFIAPITIIADLDRARSIAAAAAETAEPDKKGPLPKADNQMYIDLLTAAVSALDSAIAIARKNLPGVEPVDEKVSFG